MSSTDQEQKPADADVGWAELKPSEGDTYRAKASDYNIAEIPEAEANEFAASGPSFSNVSVYWTVGTEGSPSTDVQNQTAITWYKLAKTPWWNVVFTYELSFNTKDT